MVYRSIVRRRVLSIFAAANKGNWQLMVDELANPFVYRFIGETPLGGVRKSKEAMGRFWERMYRLFPGFQFIPQTIVVEGPPWKTKVMTYVKIVGTVPGNDSRPEPYENEFMQLLTIKWGKITSVTTIEDTLRFHKVLPHLTAAGIKDASEGPIRDI
jgi:ketosteroid isomerase-like protein